MEQGFLCVATIDVNPDVLRWARETAGLDLDSAAQRLQFVQSRGGASPRSRLEALESGAAKPTRPLLLKMAKQYRRPLLSFFLPEPPTRGDRGEDFRPVSGEQTPPMEGLVDALIRDAKARQAIVRAALEDEDEAQRLDFVGSLRIDHGGDEVCRSIRSTINFDVAQFRAERGPGEAFAYLRSRAESVGIFVLLIGDLGSHHTALPTTVFRGCSLADPVAPFVVINDQDAKSAWSFTLLHELAHLWLGQTGVSASIVDSGIERFCNDVAATLLLDQFAISQVDASSQVPIASAIEAIDAFASEGNVSRSMVAYQLYRMGKIDFTRWSTLQAEFKRLWLETRTAERSAARSRNGGPDYFVVRRYRAGHALVELVSRMTRSGTLTSTKAAKVLGVKPRSVFDMLSSGQW